MQNTSNFSEKTVYLPSFPQFPHTQNIFTGKVQYPVQKAQNLAELNHYRAHRQFYFELPCNCFVPWAAVYSPALRALALQQFVSQGDIVVGTAALWVQTGFCNAYAMQQVTLARLDGRKREGVLRRKIPPMHLRKIENLQLTNLARTAIDLLLADFESGITALPKLLKAGTSITELQKVATQLPGQKGIAQVRAVLTQLREVPALMQFK